MKHEKKSNAGRQQGSAQIGEQGQGRGEESLQHSQERGNEKNEAGVISATLPFDANGITTEEKPEEKTEQTPIVESEKVEENAGDNIIPEEPTVSPKTKQSVPFKVRTFKKLGTNVIHAKRGNSNAVFSQTAWSLMGKDKAGWVEYVPEPPEVTALKQQQQ